MPSFFCMPFTACNRQVDSLDKRQNNLQTVPHDIERYARTLEELFLDMNHIKELPKGLFRLQKLQRLGLSDNDIYRIPPEVGSLSSLIELNLSRNDISDLPEQLRELKGLSRLELSSNPFTRMPAAITLLSSLTHLGLNDVSLTQIPSDIGMLSNLRSLEVRENLIRSLPSSLCQLVRLEVLDLGQNEIDALPSDIGSMAKLRELYIDANDIELLPEQICRCSELEQLDVSENKLALLPEEVGDLCSLTDLNISHNCIQELPNSIGRMRKLSILKAERNSITSLTMSIGSCEQLQELFLTENLLTELPSSIGNLRLLKNLNVDKNQLTAIPTTFGGCHSLSVLSLRENQLADLPMDIGKCEKLSVLDLCSNKLNSLPFTINVLFKLQALWLSENQTQPMLKLNAERDPRTGVKVLTCYLLPQQSATPVERTTNRSFVGGPKVHFGDQADNTIDEEKALPIGQFERHDTPHPKPHAAKLKKNTIDGHVIHHEDDQNAAEQPSTLALKKKPSIDAGSPPGGSGQQPAAPRSAMRYQPQPNPAQYLSPGGSSAPPPATSSSPADTQEHSRSVVFSSSVADSSSDSVAPRLKRINTPHYKSIRSNSASGNSSHDDSSAPKIRRLRVTRDASGGLGLSIAGGLESTPFKDDDRGLFVSRVQSGGPADLAGLRVGDKLLRVNETDVVNVAHETAVKAMQETRDSVELHILRLEEQRMERPASQATPANAIATPLVQSPDVSFAEGDREILSTTLKRDKTGSPGFAVAGGIGTGGSEAIIISYITPGGAADQDGKLMVNDRVLSIDGTKMKNTRHDQAVALLTGHAGKELHLVVHRERASLLSPLPSTPAAVSAAAVSAAGRTPSPATSPVYSIGEASWDGKVETVDVVREGASLGLSVVGGADHASHPFGVHAPGVFVSKIAAHSAADRCGRLRVGDRILKVNDVSVKEATHGAAVEALKASGSRVRLVVSHDPQPAGMREVQVRRRGDAPLGLSIHGGVKSAPANPRDQRDEGIFIERIEPGSVSEMAGLLAGQRIIEVNGESLLGATQTEAADSLRRPLELRLLVCHGYNSTPSASASPPPAMLHSPISPASPILSSHEMTSSSLFPDLPLTSLADSAPLASSSPLPASASLRPSRLPPPVAPKPSLPTTASAIPPPVPAREKTPLSDAGQPESLSFDSKRLRFEPNGNTNNNSTYAVPQKKPLLNNDDIKRLKESEARKIATPPIAAADPLSPVEDSDDFLSQISEERLAPRTGGGSIRTKKAEQRAIAAGLIEDQYAGKSEAERREMEVAQRAEWRQKRYESLAKSQEAADALLQAVGPILNSINEDDLDVRGQNDFKQVRPLAEEISFMDD